MALIKLAAASAVGYALYKYFARRNDAESTADSSARQPVPAGVSQFGSPTTVPTAPVGLGNGYVAPT